jgi:hypothetical protein
MNIVHKVGFFSFLMTIASSAFAQPTSSPGGGIAWFVAGVAVGFAVGYYVGKNSGGSDSGGSESGDDKK